MRELETPIATPIGSTCIVARSRHIRLRCIRDRINQRSAIGALSDITTVDQYVAGLVERHAPALQIVEVLVDVACRQPRTAQLDHAVGAVRNKMDRIKVGIMLEGLVDLQKAVLTLIQHNHMQYAIS
ncbi:hypothetical protein Pla100_63200 [Neorhodopirellula pilleata]|uniref:Uncharacterized protein n=1 Tax=Neorhodopirellula pilleata TaxID=2714738 RepID=A0A5C5YQH4_9BACT|nr:hypothetical protein Pla100_63200 [Neorhodopirellula pilleata]